MSPCIVRRRVEAAYQARRRGGVVDLSRSSTLPPEELALYADLDRHEELIELSEIATYGYAMRGQLGSL